MRLIKFIILIILFSNIIYASQNINRKILVIIPNHHKIYLSNVHTKLESILNYYGYFAEYFKDEGKNYPSNTEDYVGLIYWNQGTKSLNPINLINFISKFKNKKNIIIGDIPTTDFKGKDYTKEINKILNKNFDFYLGDTWTKNTNNIKTTYKKEFFDFEKRLSFLDNNIFSEINTTNKNIEVIYKEEFDNSDKIQVSNAVFFAPWGFYGQASKVFYEKEISEGRNRWIINPFKMVERVYETNYPIPDTTTKNGKRLAYIHIDGDGILSTAFNKKYAIEEGYYFIKKQKLKTGVSFIVSELDKNGPILKNSYDNKNNSYKYDYKLLNKYAKKIFSLPFVEPASHTYSHPFNWRKGIVAYSSDTKVKKVMHGDVSAYQELNKQVNLEVEIKNSINYLQKLIPNKKVNTIYWTGDCFPSYRDLNYIEDNGYLAFNGGDSRFDLEYNSYSYILPLSLYSSKGTQIYSSNSNENTYTNLWTENYWRFKNIIKTFENTGYPKRIKPANAYYHFYSFAKKGSLNSLKTIYKYYKQDDFEFIYPSEFIKLAKNFHDIKIDKKGDTFFISNMTDLREFRFTGKKKFTSKDIVNSFYDKKLDVTYIRFKNNITNAQVKVIKS